MFDLIKENEIRFIEEQRQIAAQSTEEWLIELKQDWPSMRPRLINELTEILSRLLLQYGKMENDKTTGPLRYLQFSYLRSAVLDRTPCYRVDLYDQRWLASDLECSAPWDAAFAFAGLYGIWDDMSNNFAVQTYAQGYRLDEIMLDMADQFHWIVLHAICKTIPAIIESEPAFEALKQVKLYGGEYLDRFFLLYGEEGEA